VTKLNNDLRKTLNPQGSGGVTVRALKPVSSIPW